MRIAIVGSGISGLTAAYQLNKDHDITLFEADSRLGGHTATIDVVEGDRKLAIDTGFIVFNDWTYPNFIQLMDELGVESKPTEMGFSVCSDVENFEYSGSGLNTLFSQRRNLFSPGHWRMLRDIVRFNRESVEDWRSGLIDDQVSLGDYLEQKGYSDEFRNRYLVPMGSAIWSASMSQMLSFSVSFFVRFFHNHGLLNIVNRPQWRVIKGGSREYIAPLTAAFQDKIQLGMPVDSVHRHASGVTVKTGDGTQHDFDAIVFACHSDQALACLKDATDEEQAILGAIPYAPNSVVLHTDTSLLPSRERSWASWNYRLQATDNSLPVLTYNMNILQGIESETTYCVTLNSDGRIDPAKIIGRYEYAHPQFSVAGMEAQKQWARINGSKHTWFCGAYWANGFHEDGVTSALRVAEAIAAGNRADTQTAITHKSLGAV